MKTVLGFCLVGLCVSAVWVQGATVEFGAAKVYGVEGESSVSLPVILSSAADATVQVAIAGTAAQGFDFTSSTTLVFSVSGSVTNSLVFSIVDDALPEGPESARLRLNPVVGVTLGATTQSVLYVRDNDAFSILTANLTSGTNEVNSTTTYDDPGGRILEALCPDVVLIQEWVLKSGVTYRGFVDEYFGTNYSYYVEYQTGTYAQPNGIISRWPLVDSGEWADPEVFNRDFAWAQIQLPGPRDLRVVSVHVKASSLETPAADAATRLSQAQALTNHVATNGWLTSGYVVIGGDFNLTSRSEASLKALTNMVSDVHQPADQDGDKDTNNGRYRPYDLILPGTNLDARHCSISCYGETFPNGMVFDTRETWSGGLPPPALSTDSDAENMQHMAVMKVFEFEETTLDPPAAIWASATNTTDFTAAWDSVSNATSYRLDVGTNGTFTGGGITTGPATNGYHDGTLGAGTGGTWTETGLTQGAEYLVALSGDVLITPVMDFTISTMETLNFKARTYGGANTVYNTITVSISTNNGSSWASLGTRVPLSTSLVAMSPFDLSGYNGAQVFVKFETLGSTSLVGAGIDEVLITNETSTVSASYVSSYSNLTVAGSSQSVTGLVSGGTYFFRVRSGAAGEISSNSAVASVTLLETVPEAPALIWASDTNATDFTAAWSSAGGATSYRLDVSTSATFTSGGGAANRMSNAGFEAGDSTGWDKFESSYAIGTTDPQEGSYDVSCTAPSTRDLMQAVDITGDGVTEYEISYWYRITAGDGSDLRIWASWASGDQDSGDNLKPTTYNTATTNWTKMTYHVVPSSGANTLNFEVRTYSGATVDLDNFFVGESGGGGTPNYVSSYSNRTVAGTHQGVTGLVTGTTYYFRARAANGAGISFNSTTASVETAGTGTPPAVDTIPAQVVGVGTDLYYTVTATEPDLDTVTFDCTSAVSTNTWLVDENTGGFLFIPTASEVGTRSFRFTATDRDGTSTPVDMTVTVNSAAPTNAFEEWVEDQGEDPGDTNFYAGADVDGDGMTTEQEYLADTDPDSAGSCLVLTGAYTIATGGGTGDIVLAFPASTGRYYQLEYCTGLTNYLVGTTNLGWGVAGMAVTNNSTGTWYGVIRAFLQEP